jgi:hypothetical protein
MDPTILRKSWIVMIGVCTQDRHRADSLRRHFEQIAESPGRSSSARSIVALSSSVTRP